MIYGDTISFSRDFERQQGARRILEKGVDQCQAGQPVVVGEIEDPALLKTAARAGVGLIAAPAVIAADAREHYDLVEVGQARGLRERVYILSLERRLQHPAVVAISNAARAAFAGT